MVRNNLRLARNSQNVPAFSIKPILLTALLCMGAMMGFATVAGPITRSLGLADWHAGLIVTASGVLWMLLAPVWGRVSDRAGRKPILLVGVAGFGLAYLALAGFVNWAILSPPAIVLSLFALMAARGLIGAFYAALPPVSAAYIADNVPPSDRASFMAQLGAASGSGLVAGPFLAGVLSGWGLALPLFVFALLPLGAFVLLALTLPATAPVAKEAAKPLRMSDTRIRLPIVAAFASTFMVGAAQICIGFVLIDRLGLSLEDGARYAGFTLMGIGISLIGAQIAVAKNKQVAPTTWLAAGSITGVVACLAIALSWNPILLIGAFCLSAIGMGMIFPSFQALAANAVAAHEQGAAAGAVSAAQGLAMVIGPLAATALYSWQGSAPFVLAAILLAAILFARPMRVGGDDVRPGSPSAPELSFAAELVQAIREVRRMRFRSLRRGGIELGDQPNGIPAKPSKASMDT
jgi:DHA1 family tetracycline resistance protein-like MFS transporter